MQNLCAPVIRYPENLPQDFDASFLVPVTKYIYEIALEDPADQFRHFIKETRVNNYEPCIYIYRLFLPGISVKLFY